MVLHVTIELYETELFLFAVDGVSHRAGSTLCGCTYISGAKWLGGHWGTLPSIS